MYGPKGGHPGKELPEVNSEEQHQERIRFLYQQRQYGKDPAAGAAGMHFPPGHKPDGSDTVPGATPPHGPEPPPPPGGPGGAMGGTPGGSGGTSASAYPPPGGGGSGGLPPRFPMNTSPEAAMYHQMFLEYMLKFRNNPDFDPSSIPASQLYNTMMAEIAKQYYARHASLSKLLHQHMSSQGAPHGGPPGATAGPTPGLPGPPGGSGAQAGPGGSASAAGGSRDKLDSISSSSTRASDTPGAKDAPPQQQPTSKPYNPRGGKTGSLPKSASFQISRIAADSTSNDDYNESTDGKLLSHSIFSTYGLTTACLFACYQFFSVIMKS